MGRKLTKLYGIVLHWSAGSYNINSDCLNHYHYMVDGKGNRFVGKHKPEDNIDCYDGNYAEHTGGGNSGRIGMSMLCMANDSYPITPIQFERFCEYVAEIAIKYNIKTKEIITHAEFGLSHPNTSSKGKRDIDIIQPYNIHGIKLCGDFLRNKIQVYIDRKKRTQGK